MSKCYLGGWGGLFVNGRRVFLPKLTKLISYATHSTLVVHTTTTTMQEVICFNCGRIVHISPDAELCSVCGENLRELIHPASASTYFYERVAALATGSELLHALREVDRGLAYCESSELRLLGAILSQRIGDFVQMRHHVAAVPVDDILRSEAEWLLRAHQTRQREQRIAAGSSAINPPVLLEADPLPFEEELADPQLSISSGTSTTIRHYPSADRLDTPADQQPRQVIPRRNNMLMYLAMIVLLIVGTGVVLAATGLPLVPWFSTSISPSAGGQTPDISVPVQRTSPAITQNETTPILIVTPTPLPTIEVAEDLVQNVPEPIAESTTSSLLLNALQPVDLKPYLMGRERPDLAALEVAASSQEGTVHLDGIVPSYTARRDLIAIMREAPGVSRVSGADLLVRLPPTYTVSAGDTLWAISSYLYGEDRVAELLEANADIVSPSGLLTIGMELKVPTIE